jgi:probable HAF family extracellular repeat protein
MLRSSLAVAAGLLLAAASAAVNAGAEPASAAAVSARYAIVELSTPAGDISSANGINNAGTVVGTLTNASGVPRATRWNADGSRTDLGLLPGGASSVANGINDAGQAAGLADRSNGGYAYPVRWSAAGVVQDLGGPVVNRLGSASALDPAGRVAGGQRPADSEGDPVGILYGVNGTPTELGAGLGLARGINGYDQVVGGPGYVWKAGTVTSLPGLAGGGSTTAYAINNSGLAVGSAGTPGGSGTHGVAWRNGSIVDIGTVDGIRYSTAKSVNAAGQVVGTADPMCQPCVAPRAWIWQSGTMITALDTLLPAGSGWTLREANGISDRGEIVGLGMRDGVLHAYKMTPVLSIAVNFQPAGAPVPPGYTADTGAAYGNRGGGRTFGWNIDNSANTRDRNAVAAPDQRYDTFNHMQKPGGAGSWELAVPNGTYTVRVVAGDPVNTDSTYRINVEGVLAVSGTPTSATHWFEGSVRVTVTDGRLSITNGSGSVNDKLDVVEVIGS